MSRRALLFALIGLVVLVLPGSAFAQGPVTPQHNAPFWEATYWSNTDLAGPPALERNEAEINYDWGRGSPDPSLPSDGFSARWLRYIDTAGGVYRFTATSDDGIRVAVDDRWVINQWSDHAAQTFTADVNLSAGHHLFKVEYYENADRAVAKFSWAPASTTVGGWRGEYFNNPVLQGAPALVRDDAAVNFNWGDGSPAPGVIRADGFSARWTRNIRFSPGNYRFTVTADDGVRLWVNNHALIDVWQDQAATTYTGDIYLPGGNVPVRVEYYERAGAAVIRLSWSGGTGEPPGPPPPGEDEVIVDDTDPGFASGGAPGGWREANEGYGDHLAWTRNNDRTRPNYNWARWYPELAPGRYEVFVYIPERYSTTSGARYWISHDGGYTQRIVNQSRHGGEWVSLGTYWFRGTAKDYVSLSDVTYEQYRTQLIAFDAVKWVAR